MGQESKIAWCDSTVNFWSGCAKVSDGCRFCYAEELGSRFPTFGKWGKGLPRKLHESAFKLAAKLNRKPWVCKKCGAARDSAGVGWNHTGVGYCAACKTEEVRFNRRRIFSLSLGDWLDPEVPIEWLARMLDTVRKCNDVDWLLCTKRPELWNERMKDATLWLIHHSPGREDKAATAAWLSFWRCGEQVPSNVMVLASVENQAMADKRIPELLRIPAARRGLSCEPLLGAVDLKLTKAADLEGQYGHDGFQCGAGEYHEVTRSIHWVIIGGESGKNARPCNIEWVRSLKDQCSAAGVSCFVKQLGANPTMLHPTPTTSPMFGGNDNEDWIIKLRDPKGGDWNEWPVDLQVREFY